MFFFPLQKIQWLCFIILKECTKFEKWDNKVPIGKLILKTSLFSEIPYIMWTVCHIPPNYDRKGKQVSIDSFLYEVKMIYNIIMVVKKVEIKFFQLVSESPWKTSVLSQNHILKKKKSIIQ